MVSNRPTAEEVLEVWRETNNEFDAECADADIIHWKFMRKVLKRMKLPAGYFPKEENYGR